MSMTEIAPALGDYRWTDELILSTYYQAEHGQPPENGLEYQTGASDGGFDVLDFKWLPEDEWLPESAELICPSHSTGAG